MGPPIMLCFVVTLLDLYSVVLPLCMITVQVRHAFSVTGRFSVAMSENIREWILQGQVSFPETEEENFHFDDDTDELSSFSFDLDEVEGEISIEDNVPQAVREVVDGDSMYETDGSDGRDSQMSQNTVIMDPTQSVTSPQDIVIPSESQEVTIAKNESFPEDETYYTMDEEVNNFGMNGGGDAKAETSLDNIFDSFLSEDDRLPEIPAEVSLTSFTSSTGFNGAWETSAEDKSALIPSPIVQNTKTEGAVEGDTVELNTDTFGRHIERKQDRRHWYQKGGNFGANFNILNGERMDGGWKSSVITTCTNRTDTLFDKLISDSVTYDELIHPPIDNGYKYLEPIKIDSDVWAVMWTPEELSNLQTADIQRYVCAALNSRLHLKWLIGVVDGKAVGCPITRTDRDLLASGFVWSISREFVPDLDPTLVNFNCVPVWNEESGEYRMMIEITLNKTVNTIYQLSSGKCWHVKNGNVSIGNIEEIRCLMLSNVEKNTKDNCGLSWNSVLLFNLASLSIGVLATTVLQKIMKS